MQEAYKLSRRYNSTSTMLALFEERRLLKWHSNCKCNPFELKTAATKVDWTPSRKHQVIASSKHL
eukprot:scaffold41238_cov19-Prasinocladus_malaysianus.AAC.2